jgi:hypothetical protein
VLSALADAAVYRDDQAAGYCTACATSGAPGKVCGRHAADLADATAYRALSTSLGDRPLDDQPIGQIDGQPVSQIEVCAHRPAGDGR